MICSFANHLLLLNNSISRCLYVAMKKDDAGYSRVEKDDSGPAVMLRMRGAERLLLSRMETSVHRQAASD